MSLSNGTYYSQTEGLKFSTSATNRVIISTAGTTTFTGITSGSTLIAARGVSGGLMSVTDTNSGPLLVVNNSIGNTIFQVNSNNSIIGGTPFSNTFVVSGASVGMGGVVSPTNTLHVTASTHPVRFVGLQSSGNTRYLVSNTDGVMTYREDLVTTAMTATTLYLGNGTLSGNRTVNLSTFTLNFSSSTQANTLFLSGGSVGIGTASLRAKLDVNGDINFPTTTGSTYGVIEQNGVRFLHTYGTENLFLGAGAGNFTTTGYGCIGIGQGSLSGNTVGVLNVGLGFNSLSKNQTGNQNIAIGYYAQLQNLNGGANVGIGQQSIQNNTNGSYNVGVGSNTLFATLGSNNTAIGSNALISTQGSGNVAIGYQAGFSETTSNKLWIANDNVTPLIGGDFSLRRVGINIAPASITNALHISGGTNPVRIENLSSSANTRFLVSNADGVITYRTDVMAGTDVFVTGGSYNTITSTITFTNNTGGTFTVTGITASGGGGGTSITGGTYDIDSGTLSLSDSASTITVNGFLLTGYTTANTSTTSVLSFDFDPTIYYSCFIEYHVFLRDTSSPPTIIASRSGNIRISVPHNYASQDGLNNIPFVENTTEYGTDPSYNLDTTEDIYFKVNYDNTSGKIQFLLNNSNSTYVAIYNSIYRLVPYRI